MRFRQFALASTRLDEVVRAFSDAFGLKVAFNDPGVVVYGLRNAVMPAGTGFIEVVEPVKEGTSAGRFIDRRGGDAGYMILLQVRDAQAERDRVAADGVRVVDDIDRPDYRCSHFHPADFGGVLASFDQQRTETDLFAPHGDWMPAGPGWQHARTDVVRDMTSVTIASAQPRALAQRWSTLTGRALDAADPTRLPLDQGEVRFADAGEGAATVITQVTLRVGDVAGVTARARAAGLDVNADGVLIGGVRFLPVA